MELNKIYCGDCLSILPSFPPKSIDMILCDLPYGTTACKWDVIIPFEPLWKEYKRVIKDNGAIVLTASQPFTSALVMSNLKMFKYEWAWEKEQGLGNLNAKKRPLIKYENIVVFYRNQPTYNPQMTQGRPYKIVRQKNKAEFLGKNGTKDGYVTENNGERYPTNILFFKRELKDRYHPTQKPVALFEYLIKTYTNEGDLVLDNCAGSGTTGVACKRLKRNYVLIEKEENYCKIAEERIREVNELF